MIKENMGKHKRFPASVLTLSLIDVIIMRMFRHYEESHC